ncbi:Fic family protein [Elusimicrobiota bacterium]
MPYKPIFTITPHLLKIIEDISTFREKILSSTIQVPWIPMLQKDTRIRNAHSSTAIEGNPLTLEQARLLEEGQKLATETERSQREIFNYFAGLRFIEKHAAKKRIDHQDILQLHKIIASNVMDQGASGHYRSMRVRVGIYIPPPPENVFSLMSEFLAWWNKESNKWSPVITSSIVHYRFEAIHPFADGNGRTGRLLALWELYRRDFDIHHIFSVDEAYWENRQRYYKSLSMAEREHGDISGWLEYTAEALHLTLKKVWMRIQRLSASKKSKKIVLRPKQEQLLQILRDKQSLTPAEIRKSIGVSKQGAMDLLNPMIKAGLIRRIGTRKSGKYVLA